MGLSWDCPAELSCATWALSYFLDCVCSLTDTASFFLGIASIVCWGFAEVPQILVNLRSPSTEGVSLAFIFTWMIGDIFNLAGCLISPGTLPTQFYLAVLYTGTTFLLVGQQLWLAWTSYRESRKLPDADPLLTTGRSERRPSRRQNDLQGLFPSDQAAERSSGTRSLPVLNKRGRHPLPMTVSLPGPPFPEPAGTYSRSWRRFTGSSSSASPVTRGPPKLLFSSLVIVGVTLGTLSPFDGSMSIEQGALSSVGVRRLLHQDGSRTDMEESLGLILGWLMTCIYLTGRLPQIILNWSREFVIGVPTSTIVFAFLGNATYLGSILVRSIKWRRLKPVLPWVIDITCCLVMDICMTTRYLIHQYREGFTMLE